MRIRQFDTPIHDNTDYWEDWSSALGWVARADPGIIKYIYSSHSSYMEDVANKKQFLFHPCRHSDYRTTSYFNLSSIGYVADPWQVSALPCVDPSGSAQMVWVSVAKLIRSTDAFASGLGWTSLVSAQWRLINAAMSQVDDHIVLNKTPLESDFSIWYLLVDLVDLVSLHSLFTMFRRFNKRTLSRMGSFAKANPRMTLKDVANTHLMVEFGVKPTLSDMHEFLIALDRFRNLEKIMGDWLKKRHVYRVKTDAPAILNYSFTRDYVVTVPLSEVSLKATVQNRCTANRSVAYSARLPELRGFMARLRQFIDIFGVLDPAAVWDVIPFSFIVDWFINVGEWLHNIRPRAFPIDLLIDGYLKSVSNSRDVLWSASWLCPRYDGTGTTTNSRMLYNYPICQEQIRTYTRQFGSPIVVGSLPRASNPLLWIRRAIISSSLVTQRVPRRTTL